jgi:hypothetical protein
MKPHAFVLCLMALLLTQPATACQTPDVWGGGNLGGGSSEEEDQTLRGLKSRITVKKQDGKVKLHEALEFLQDRFNYPTMLLDTCTFSAEGMKVEDRPVSIPEMKNVTKGEALGRILRQVDAEHEVRPGWIEIACRPGWVLRSLPQVPHAALAFSPDGKTLAAARWYTLYLYDLNTGQELLTVTPDAARGDMCRFMTLSPDGKRLVSVHMGRSLDGPETIIRLWNLTDQRQLRKVGTLLSRGWGQGDAPTAIYHAAFSPDSKTVVAGTRNGTVYQWDAATGRELRHFPGGAAVAFAPDGRVLISVGQDGLVHRWDARSGRCLDPGHDSERKDYIYAEGAAFSPDGKRLAVCDARSVSLKDAFTGNQIRRVSFPQGLSEAAFAPDGRTLAVATFGRGLWFYDASTGVERCWRKGEATLAFAPDGKRVAWGDGEAVLVSDLAAALASPGQAPPPALTDRPGVPLRAELKLRKDTYRLDLGDRTPNQFSRLITTSRSPPAPRVSLEFRLRNTSSKRTLKVQISSQPEIFLVGDGAVNLRLIRQAVAILEKSETVTLGPGDSYTLSITDLSPSHDIISYWTAPG